MDALTWAVSPRHRNHSFGRNPAGAAGFVDAPSDAQALWRYADSTLLSRYCPTVLYECVLSRPRSLLRKPTKVSGCWILLVHRLPLHHHLVRKPVEQFCRERQRCHSAHALNINNLDKLDTKLYKQPWQVCLQLHRASSSQMET